MPNEFVAKNGLVAQNNSVVSGSLVVTNGITGSLFGTSSQAVSASYTATSSFGFNAVSASYAFTASSATSASFASTASFVNTLNQNVVITGSLTVGTASGAYGENTLAIGPSPAGGSGEGGQLLLMAKSDGFTSASMLDTYQNRFRVLRGTNTGSDAEFLNVNLDSGQIVFNKYIGSGTFPGTAVANLAVDSGGNILTVAAGTITSASYAYTASSAISASYAFTASSASNSFSASYARTSSFANNFTVANTLTAQTLVVSTISSSVVYSSGSNIFGNSLTNVQQFTGSLRVTGAGDHWILGGRLGIGVVDPAYTVDTQGDVRVGNNLILTSSGTGIWAAPRLFRSGTWIGVSDFSGVQLGGYDGVAYGPRFTVMGSGNTGVGLVNPTALFHISGSGSGSLMQISSHVSSSIFFVSGSGNVGFGTTSPRARVHATGSGIGIIGDASDNFFGNYSTGDYIDIGHLGVASGNVYLDTRGVSANVSLSYRTKGTGNHIWTYAGGVIETMRVNGGNLGVGITNPAAILHVSGSTTGSLFRISSHASSSLFFVSGSGNVGIGTITPEFKLDVSGSGQARIGSAEVGNWPSVTNYAFFGHERLDHTAAGNYALLQFQDGSTYVNASTGRTLHLRINNSTKATIEDAGFTFTGSFGLSGSLLVTGSITGSLSGSVTGSLFGTASWARNAITASYALGGDASAILYQTASAAFTWSFNHFLQTQYPVFTIYDNTNSVIVPQRIQAVDTSSALIYFSSPTTGIAVASKGGYSSSVVTSATTANTAISASFASSGTGTFSGSFSGSYEGNFSGSYFGTASQALSASYAATSSFANNFTVANTLTAQTIVVSTISSSVVYSSGSNIFGNSLSNTQTFTGSLNITGGINLNSSKAIIGDDISYGAAYQTLAFGGATNGFNRISGHSGTLDGLYFMAATGRGFSFRPNGATIGKFIIASTGRVGIGDNLSSPNALLQVSGSGTDNLFQLSSTVSSSIFFVSGSGRIGLGTTTPSSSLTLAGGDYTLNFGARSAQAQTSSMFQDTSDNLNVRFGGTQGKFLIIRSDNNQVAQFKAGGFDVTGTTTISNGLYLTGSFGLSGSLLVTGSITGSLSGSVTGSLFGTASQAVSSSYALTASFALNAGGGGFPFSGSAQITGSLGVTGSFSVSANQGSSVFSSNADTLLITGSLIITGSGAAITGSLNVSNGITGSLFGTASQAVTASYALTASFVASIAGLSTSQIATGSITASVSLGSGSFAVTSGSSTFFFISSSGESLVNTTIAQNVAANRGNLTINGTTSILNLATSNTNAGYLFHGGTDMLMVNAKNGALTFATNNTERARIDSSGRMGIGTSTPSASLDVSGSFRYTNGLSGTGSVNISGSTLITGSLNVSGGITTNGTITAQTLVVQTITSSITYSSGSNIFGNALTNTQTMTGSVNITGSLTLRGNQTVFGVVTVQSASFDYGQNTNVVTGSFQVIASEATSSFRCAFFDYVMFSGSVVRAGTVTSTWSGGAVEFNESYTNDLSGSTAGVTLQAALSGGNIQLQATASSQAWTIRSLIRLL